MEQTKVFTISIQGTDLVLKDMQSVKKEIDNTSKLISSMGISVDNQNSVKLFAKELSKVVDIASKTDDEIEQLSLHLKEATMNGVKLGDAIKSIPSNLKIDFGNKMIDNAIKGLQQLENETESTKRLLQALDVKDATPQQIEASRQQLKMMSLDLSKLDKQQQEAAFKRIKENKMLSESIINPNQSRTGGKAGGASQLGQQVGFQGADALVMAQMGMDTSKIIAQQGSQMVAAFNPMLGLGVVVASILGGFIIDMLELDKVSKETKKSLEDFEKVTVKIADAYFTMNEDIQEYVELSRLEGISLETKNDALDNLIEKYDPYIKQIQKNALEVGKVMTAEEALLEFQKDAINQKILLEESLALKKKAISNDLQRSAIESDPLMETFREYEKLRTKINNEANKGIKSSIDEVIKLNELASQTVYGGNSSQIIDANLAKLKELDKADKELANSAKGLKKLGEDGLNSGKSLSTVNNLLDVTNTELYDVKVNLDNMSLSAENWGIVFSKVLKEGAKDIADLKNVIADMEKEVLDMNNKLNLEEAKGNNVLGKRVELAEKELELAKEKLKLTEKDASRSNNLTKDQQAVIDAEIKYEKAKTAAREDGRKKREAAEKKELDKQVANLDKLKSAYDEANKKLEEMVKSGSLEDIAKAEKELVKAQTEYNKGIDEAVEKTKNYKIESEKLNEIRAKGNAINQSEKLKSELVDLEKQMKEYDKTVDGVYKKVTDTYNNLSEVVNSVEFQDLSGSEKQIVYDALALAEGYVTTGEITYENLKKLAEMSDIDSGITGKDLAIVNTLDSSRSKIAARVVEINEKLAKIDVSFGGTKGYDEGDKMKALTTRVETMSKDVASAFFEGLQRSIDELFEAGTILISEVTVDIKNKDNIKIDNIAKSLSDKFKDFNTLFEKEGGGKIFELTDGALQINQDVVDKITATLTDEQRATFNIGLEQLKKAILAGNKEIEAININQQTDLLNIYLDFTDKYIKAYKERNRFEIREQKHLTERLKYEEEVHIENILDVIKKEADERKKKGKKISDDEKFQLELRKSIAIGMVKDRQQEEFKLYEMQERRSLEAAQKQLDAMLHSGEAMTEEQIEQQKKSVALLQAELDLKLAMMNKADAAEIAALKKKFDELSGITTGDDGGDDWRDRLGRFLTIFNAANELAQILVDIAIQQQQNLVDNLQENISKLDQQIADSQAKLSELEDDLAGKQSGRRDAILRGIELEKQRERELTEQKLKQQRELEKAEKKLANQRKAAAITQAVINGALAVTNILATTVDPTGVYKAVLIGISAATTAAQIALISQQKFAKGGFTGKGDGQRDETGFKVAGVVHQDEWVAPKWMVESPKYGGMINELESVRQKGFAEGGFTNENANIQGVSSSFNNNVQMMQMQQYTVAAMNLANRPIVANPVEFNNVSDKQYRRINSNTI